MRGTIGIRFWCHFSLCILIYYIYVYSPAFIIIPFGADKIVFILSYIYLFYSKKWNWVLNIFRKELYILFIICIISGIILIIHRKENSLFLYDVLLLLEAIPCSVALWLYFEKSKIKDKYRIIIYSSIISGIITLYFILHPDLMMYFKESVIKYPERLKTSFVYRGFGLSDGLLFSFPVIQGYVAGWIFIKINKVSILIQILTISLCCICIIVNARSGFVPLFLGLFIGLFYNLKKEVKLISYFFIFFILIGGFVTTLIENNDLLNIAVEWSKSSIDIINALFRGEKTENVDALTGDMLFFPNSIDGWLVGIGLNVGGSDLVLKNSDIGYVIRLMYGGIIYLIFWIILWLIMARRLIKVDKSLTLLLFGSLLYLNYKGDFFVGAPSSRFFFLVYVWSILNKLNSSYEHYLYRCIR